jgi:hypothetical protein
VSLLLSRGVSGVSSEKYYLGKSPPKHLLQQNMQLLFTAQEIWGYNFFVIVEK